MRRLWVSAGLVVLLAVLSGLHVWHLNGFTGQLTGLLTQAQELAALEDWEGAARLTRQAKDRWTGHESYLHITLRHTDIDAILVSLDETLAFLEEARSSPRNTPPSTPGCSPSWPCW